MMGRNEVAGWLTGLRMFSGVSAQELEACAHLWTLREYEADTALWWQGELANALAIVLKGELLAHLAGEEVGRIKAGELVGESAAFFRDRRTATVSTVQYSTVALMSRDQIIELRAKFTDVYDHLLDEALRLAALRVKDADKRIARLSEGSREVKGDKAPTFMSKLKEKLRKPFVGKPPSVIIGLRSSSVFYAEKDNILTAIGASMTPRYLEPGEAIFREGEPGSSVFVLADGCVEVIRNVGVGKGEPLASLFPGAIFGTGSLLLRERRNATCASDPNTASWVYEMDARAHAALRGKPGRRWREALLSALWFQLSRANEQLSTLMRGGERAGKTDYELVRAGLVATNSKDKIRTPWEFGADDH